MKKLFILFIVFCINIHADEINILFLGDTHFGDNYQTNPKYNRGLNIIKKYGYDYFFKNVRSILDSSDFIFANLESPLIFNPKTNYNEGSGYMHWSDADSTGYYLNKYHISAVNIANNHIFDFGTNGYNSTIMGLNKYNIASFGAGNNQEDASKPIIKKFKIGNQEFEIAVIGAYWFRNNFEIERDYYAKENHLGVNMLDVKSISEEVMKIRNYNSNAFIVVYPHWGSNYSETSDYQIDLAHKLIDAGVDMIIGQGAHKMQRAEQYKGKLIIYNLGNFIFNAPGRYKAFGVKPFSLIAKLIIDDSMKKKLRLYPIYTDNLQTNYLVRLLDENEYNECFELLNEKDIIEQKGYFEILLN